MAIAAEFALAASWMVLSIIVNCSALNEAMLKQTEDARTKPCAALACYFDKERLDIHVSTWKYIYSGSVAYWTSTEPSKEYTAEINRDPYRDSYEAVS